MSILAPLPSPIVEPLLVKGWEDGQAGRVQRPPGRWARPRPIAPALLVDGAGRVGVLLDDGSIFITPLAGKEAVVARAAPSAEICGEDLVADGPTMLLGGRGQAGDYGLWIPENGDLARAPAEAALAFMDGRGGMSVLTPAYAFHLAAQPAPGAAYASEWGLRIARFTRPDDETGDIVYLPVAGGLVELRGACASKDASLIYVLLASPSAYELRTISAAGLKELSGLDIPAGDCLNPRGVLVSPADGSVCVWDDVSIASYRLDREGIPLSGATRWSLPAFMGERRQLLGGAGHAMMSANAPMRILAMASLPSGMSPASLPLEAGAKIPQNLGQGGAWLALAERAMDLCLVLLFPGPGTELAAVGLGIGLDAPPGPIEAILSTGASSFLAASRGGFLEYDGQAISRSIMPGFRPRALSLAPDGGRLCIFSPRGAILMELDGDGAMLRILSADAIIGYDGEFAYFTGIDASGGLVLRLPMAAMRAGASASSAKPETVARVNDRRVPLKTGLRLPSGGFILSDGFALYRLGSDGSPPETGALTGSDKAFAPRGADARIVALLQPDPPSAILVVCANGYLAEVDADNLRLHSEYWVRIDGPISSACLETSPKSKDTVVLVGTETGRIYRLALTSGQKARE